MMEAFARISTVIVVAASLAACSISSILGGGAKTPTVLSTLTSTAPAAALGRSAPTGETVMIEVPVVPPELRTQRVPVQVSPSQVQYVKDLEWVSMPNRLFQQLVEETVQRTTNRIAVDPKQAAVSPGLVVAGELNRFGYDAEMGSVVVQYDASLATQGGTHVQTRRFEAAIPTEPTAEAIAPALNVAANQVALEVARWIGG